MHKALCVYVTIYWIESVDWKYVEQGEDEEKDPKKRHIRKQNKFERYETIRAREWEREREIVREQCDGSQTAKTSTSTKPSKYTYEKYMYSNIIVGAARQQWQQ